VKFVEQHLSAWWALVVGIALAALIIKYGDKFKFESLINLLKRSKKAAS